MSQKVYWTNPKFTDRRRWRKEYRDFMKAAGGAGSNAAIVGTMMWESDDVNERENARVILADIAEENGFAYLPWRWLIRPIPANLNLSKSARRQSKKTMLNFLIT